MDEELQNPEEETKVGRPTIFTPELSDRICEGLAQGKSLRTIVKGEGMPCLATIFSWLRTNPSFLDQYTRAKEAGTEALADEILDIADDSQNDWMEVRFGKDYKTVYNREHADRSKLRIDSRKWLLSKLKAKKYGDKLDVTTDGEKLPTPIYGGKSAQ